MDQVIYTIIQQVCVPVLEQHGWDRPLKTLRLRMPLHFSKHSCMNP